MFAILSQEINAHVNNYWKLTRIEGYFPINEISETCKQRNRIC